MNSDDYPSLDELAALLPQYRFEHLIAEGGMGAVYRAEQVSLARPVAIKILPRSLSVDEAYREQFKTEARLMGSLNYPHIVDIHDFGQAGEVLYIVMELLEGMNLYQRMIKEPLKQQEIVRILTQACDALTAAHHKGVVHRDVKPENIFIEPGLRVKLGDFGISRRRRSDMDSLNMAVSTDMRLGTPEYAAPELYDFQKQIDHRADLFSLGVVLYELLTGARPTGAFIAPSQRKPGVDRRFDSVVVRAMQLEPADRYASAEDMKKDLLKVIQAPPQPARAPVAGKTPTGQKGTRPKPPAATRTSGKSASATAATPNRKTGKSAPEKKVPAVANTKRKNPALLWGSVVGAAALAGFVVAVLNGGGKEKKGAAAVLEKADVPADPFAGGVTKPAPPASPMPSPDNSPPSREPGPPAAKLTVGGSTYQYLPSRLTWAQAKAEAERQGGHLACVTTQAEYDALRAYLMPLLKQEYDSCWLGASDAETEGTWKWLTGEPFEFKAWATTAPSNGGGQDAQNYLAWQRRAKYPRQIEWNDIAGSMGDNAIGGALIEWEKPAGRPAPTVAVVKPSDKPVPVPVPSPPPDAPVLVSSGWQPLTWTDADIQKLSGKVTLTDGWYTFTSAAALEAPPAAGFVDGAVRARVRIGEGARAFEIKPRYAKENALICSLEMPGTVKVVRRASGASTTVAEWPLADRLQAGDEVRLEMRLTGPAVAMRFNGITLGSIDTGDTSTVRTLRVSGEGLAARDIEWLPLDGVTDPDRALTAPSSWPAHGPLTAACAEFAQKKDAAYAGKLSAPLKSLRDSYIKRLRELAGQKPAEAAVLHAEAALATAGSDPPPAGAPGATATIAALRKTWHEARAGIEKPIAATALTLWREHLDALQNMDIALRRARKLADAADLAPHLSEASAAVARFAALVPGAVRSDNHSAGTGGSPLKRPAIHGKVIVWRRGPDITHDMGAAEIPPDLGPVVAIAAGPAYALALRPDGTVVQWGTAFAKHVEPPAGLTDVVAIDAGTKFAAALRSDGSIVAWGFEHRGKLVPPGLRPAVAISAGHFQGHALHPDGTVSYFGWPVDNQSSTFAPPSGLTGVRALDCGKEVTLTVRTDGTLAFIGSNADQQISGLPAKLKPVSLAACASGICAALAGGDTLHFWGRSLKDKDTDYARGSLRFPAVQLIATPHSRTIAARNAAGDWKFFGHLDTTDLKLASRNAKGALLVTFSEDHLLALLQVDGRR